MASPHRIERKNEHRPWPLPAGPWIMFQSWRELLFAHWPLPRKELRPLVPPQLTLETFGGDAWIGLTPFLLSDLRPRGAPLPPFLSSFPEMNLRTYVRVGKRPGIFFFTLETTSLLAILGARIFYRLPYRRARMRISRAPDRWIRYQSQRRSDHAAFSGRYRPTGPTFRAEPGSLEHFLTERYALYAVLRRDGVLRGEIHHAPWALQTAELEIERNTLAAAHGIDIAGRRPLCHYAARQDTLVWTPRRVR